MTDLEAFTLQFESEFDNARIEVIEVLKPKSTQTERANRFGVSLRTIQHFENTDNPDKCRNYKLLYFYRLAAFGDAVV